MSRTDEYKAWLQRARQGDRRAQRDLTRALELLVRTYVRVGLRPWRGRVGLMEEDDVVNEILGKLCVDGFAQLDHWDPKRGELGLYISLYVRHRLIDLFRKEGGPKSKLSKSVPLESVTESVLEHETPEDVAAARERGERLRKRVDDHFKTLEGRMMVELLFGQQMSDDAILKITGKTKSQIYNWRNRIRKTALQCYERLFSEDDS